METAFAIKTESDIVEDFIATVISRTNKVSDTTEGSLFRSIAEGVGLVVNGLYVDTYLGFRRNLRNVREGVFQVPRKSGSRATTDVVFSRTDTTDSISFSEGVEVSTGDGLVFVTQTNFSVDAGTADSDPIPVVAEEVGREYNVGSGSISSIETNEVDDAFDSVTNSEAAVGGTDQETEFEYSRRFQAYIEGLGRSNPAGIQTAALEEEEVRSTALVEHNPPVEVGGVHYSFTLYIDDRSTAGVSEEIEDKIQDKIDGDDTEDNPGWRSAGVRGKVERPTIITQDVTLDLTIEAGSNQGNIQDEVASRIRDAINQLDIGKTLIRRTLYTEIFMVVGVVDAEITSPSANVVPSSDEVLRAGDVDYETVTIA